MNADAPSPWRTYRRLLGYARPYHWLLLAAGLGMTVEAGSAAAFTALMEPMVDQTFVAHNPEVRWTLPLAIVGLFVLRGLATWVTDVGMARSGRSVVRDLRAAVMSKYLRLPNERFDREPVASLVSRLNYDTEQVTQATSEAIKVVVTDTLTIAALLGVMLYQSVRVTLAMLVVAPLIAAISGYVGARYRRINRGIQSGVANMAQAAEEVLSGQQEVKIYGARSFEEQRYRALAERNLRLNLKIEATRASASSVVQMLAAVALAVILVVAGREAAAGRMSAGSFVALMMAMMALIPSLKRITNIQSAVQRGIAAAERLFALLDEPDEPDHGTRPLPRARGEIVFENVSVQYPNQPVPAIEGISFRARPGTVTAIVGRSGSGKSTLIRLLPRFYAPSAGRVLLDGVPIEEYRLADQRDLPAQIGQQVMLFDGSVGENGGLLSGGQRQRVAIARAMLKDAPILVLDEATAALDNESERLVQEAFAHLIPDRTTLVIAHRLSTIEHADQVLVLDQGRLVEQGTHAELLARGGVYAHLHRMQFREDGAGR